MMDRVDEGVSLTRGGGSEEGIALWDGHWDELAAAVVGLSWWAVGFWRAVKKRWTDKPHNATATLATAAIAALAARSSQLQETLDPGSLPC